MKKVVSIILCLAMMLSFVTSVCAAPEATTFESTKVVNIVGRLDEGDTKVNVLIRDGETIKHIDEVDVAEDGEYRIRFKCEDVTGLTVQVKQGDEDVTSSVISAVAESEAIVYTLDVVNSPVNTEVVAEIENYYNITGKEYQVVIAYYGEGNTLQNVIINDQKVEDGLNLFAEDFKIPDDAKKIKVFMWDNTKTMIPLAESVEGKKNDVIRVLAIGNSYAVDAYDYLDDLAKEAGVNMELRIAQQSGATFTKHWNTWTATTEEGRKKYSENGEKHDIAHFLEDGTRYDYITIQQSSAHSGNREQYLVNAENVVKYIRERQPTAEILIHQTWSNERNSPVEAFVDYYGSDREFMVKEINWCVNNAREVLGKVKTDSGLEVSPGGKPLRYIPAGDAVNLARLDPMFDTTYTGTAAWDDVNNYLAPENVEDSQGAVSLHRDSYHMSRKYGRYLVALVWFRCLTGQSVADNTFTYTGNGGKYAITEDAREIINAAAQKAVDDSGIWDKY